ncbi:MAG: hypothetical protein V4726_02395 [Verrucomicrobiota bacterium]
MKFPRLALFLSGLPAAVLVLLIGPASARLGETPEQCTARYGMPVAETAGLLQGSKSISFSKAGIRVRIEFIDGQAAFLSFSKHGLTDDDERQLLESNAAKQIWSKMEEFVGRRCWIAPAQGEDEPRYASSYITGTTTWLDIASKKWADAIRAQKLAMTAALPKPKPKTADTPGIPSSAAGQAPAAPKKPGTLDGF